MKNKKFTIIELLVIVAIIAILAALLFPSLNKAREMGKRIGCMSSIKQVGLCWLTYVGDNHGYIYPNTASGYGWKSGTKSFTTLYGIKDKAMSCPSGVIKSSYSASAHYSCNNDSLKNMPDYGHGLLVRIQSPQKKLVFCDYGTDSNINSSYGSAGSAVVYINYVPGCGQYGPAAAKLTNAFAGYSVADVGKEAFLNDFMNGRHLRSVSIFFVDGHVENQPAMKVAPQFYPPCTRDPLFKFWNTP